MKGKSILNSSCSEATESAMSLSEKRQLLVVKDRESSIASGADTQARSWLLTINNPDEHGLTETTIRESLERLSLVYFCFSFEKGESGTLHAHIYLISNGAIRFSTLKNRFPTAHLEMSRGKPIDNRNYVAKQGKWEEDEKSATSIPGSFFEEGELPIKERKLPVYEHLKQMLAEGKTLKEIFEEDPRLLLKKQAVENVKEFYHRLESCDSIRDIEVIYMFGPPGSGKTRSIFGTHHGSDIYRVTNYRGQNGVLFDNYLEQPVLVFEEFRSQIAISDMLNYLDVYPIQLPARYADRTGDYTMVYITSNLPLDKQYQDVQIASPATWKAFLRRITCVREFKSDGTIFEYDPKKVGNGGNNNE